MNDGIVRAQLVEISSLSKDSGNLTKASDGDKVVPVQFNPQTLKLSYANENKGGDQPGGGGKQFIGNASAKLSLELLFDTTETGKDVRATTRDVAYFMLPNKKAQNKKNRASPPSVRFEWGSFIFEGVVDSMQETLDYFSESGIPLRSTVSLSISQREVVFLTRDTGTTGSAVPGTAPLASAKKNDNLPRMAGNEGRSSDWKSIAAANNVDDPLRLQPGMLLNMNVSAGTSFSANAGFQAAASGSASFSAGAGLQAGTGANADAQAGLSAGLGAGVGFGAGGSASASASAGAGVSAGVGASAGANIGLGGGMGASAGASAGFSADFGAEAGFGASAGASASASSGAGGVGLP